MLPFLLTLRHQFNHPYSASALLSRSAATRSCLPDLSRMTRSFLYNLPRNRPFATIHSQLSMSFTQSSTKSAPPTKWSDVVSSSNNSTYTSQTILSRTIPPLTSSSHKGSSGRVGILGGSKQYTGAPYYAAMSSLRTGADLSFVFCAEEAAVPIKCYSPELMVLPIYSAAEFEELQSRDDDVSKEEEEMEVVNQMVQRVSNLMDRMHVLIIGPGLGRCPLVLRASAEIVREGKRRGLAMVLDADALFLVCQEEYRDVLCFEHPGDAASSATIVLTPNVVEYNRLVDTIGNESEELLRKKLAGVVLVKKGCEDVIEQMIPPPSSSSDTEHSEVTNLSSFSSSRTPIHRMVCQEEGGLKRSGGLGDILSGMIGTFVAWNEILSRSQQQKLPEGSISNNDEITNDIVLGCWLACCLTKRATNKAFQIKKRSMTAPDVLDEVGSVVDDIATSTIVWDDK